MHLLQSVTALVFYAHYILMLVRSIVSYAVYTGIDVCTTLSYLTVLYNP